MKKFNMNRNVKVKLTPLGVDIFHHENDEVNEYILTRGGIPLEQPMPQIDADGLTEFQLWEFIQMYGNYIGICRESVIVDCTLYFNDKDLLRV